MKSTFKVLKKDEERWKNLGSWSQGHWGSNEQTKIYSQSASVQTRSLKVFCKYVNNVLSLFGVTLSYFIISESKSFI